MKLRLALVAVILAGGAPVGAWAEDYQCSCNLNSSVVNHTNRTGNGTAEVIPQFDPTAKETLFIPRLVGG
jgi:hypothetical protein